MAAKSKNSTGMITVTFGDVCENGISMKKHGEEHAQGFTCDELRDLAENLEGATYVSLDELLPEEARPGDVIFPEAGVLHLQNGLETLFDMDPDEFFEMLNGLEWDREEKSRRHKNNGKGGVIQLRARYKLCFTHESCEPSYADGQGRVYAFAELPLLDRLRVKLSEVMGESFADLLAEGNNYYIAEKCGIGYHGDVERTKVAACRVYSDPEANFPIYYQWYYRGARVGDRIPIDLHHGDVYVMSEMAVGRNWKRRIIPTLRHATGCQKYVK